MEIDGRIRQVNSGDDVRLRRTGDLPACDNEPNGQDAAVLYHI